MTNYKMQYENNILLKNKTRFFLEKEKEYGFCMQYVAWEENIWYNMMNTQNTFGRKRDDWNKDQKQ